MLKNQLKHIIGIVVGVMAVLFMVGGDSATAQTRPEVAKYAKVYIGAEGLRVTTLRVGPRERNEYLVGIRGIDHPWDGKIFVHRFEDVSSSYRQRYEFSMPYHGHTYTTIILRGDSYGEIYLEGERKERTIYLSEELSDEVIPEHFLTEYLEQRDRNDRAASLEIVVDPATLQQVLKVAVPALQAAVTTPTGRTATVVPTVQTVAYTKTTRSTTTCKKAAPKRKTQTATVCKTTPKRQTQTVEVTTDNRRNSGSVDLPGASLKALGVEVNINQ
ncbi:MAG: hypothetical protein K1Y36_18500 [Blastocatellia bacterium]|nr:hypothetical protein [Blastocatellia bacterium]